MLGEFEITHHEVFRRPGAFAGWPANYGLWSWEQEILSVFALGNIGPKGEIHELDRNTPFLPTQARSLDGGMTWTIEPFNGTCPGGVSLSADEHLDDALKTRPRLKPSGDLMSLRQPIDFLNPETIVMCARTGLAQDAVSWFYVSRSRGRAWDGPFAFTGLRLPIAARTDIVPISNSEALWMLTTAKKDGTEGRVFGARTRDGGLRFEFAGFVGDEPQGFRIMPSSTTLPDGSIVTATRCEDKEDRHGWIEVYHSKGCRSKWIQNSVAVEDTGREGNPGALALFQGRLVLVYGNRNPPYGICLRTSDDAGKSWAKDLVLRSDGGTADIGYPRMVSTDSALVVVYYFNKGEGNERYIAATRLTTRR